MADLGYDIIVAGGSTAGSAAAVAAARRGHRVLLGEEQNCLGGVSTAGGVGEWFASLKGLGNVFDDVLQEMTRYGTCVRWPERNSCRETRRGIASSI